MVVRNTLLAIILLACGSAMAQASEAFRAEPIILNAAAILPPEWQRGINFELAPEVINDGVFNRYSLKTAEGWETLDSNVALASRIQELRALAAMDAMSRSEVMGDALIAAAKSPFQGAAALMTSPIDTSRNIVRGTGRFFGNLGHALFSSEPEQDNAIKVILGYDVAKRRFAYELGIDPYTDYEPVIRRLGELSRAAVAGGIAPSALLSSVDFSGAALLQFSASADGMRQLVRDNPPGTLREINRAKLSRMGIEDGLIEIFLDNYHYNPFEETLLVGALDSMVGVAGREVMLTNASLAGSSTSARFNRVIAQMMATFHARGERGLTVVDAGGAVGLRREDGTLMLIAPVDYLFWTEGVASNLALLDRELEASAEFSSKEIWLSGRVDPAAKEKFEAAGWQLHEDAYSLFTAALPKQF